MIKIPYNYLHPKMLQLVSWSILEAFVEEELSLVHEELGQVQSQKMHFQMNQQPVIHDLDHISIKQC